MILSELYDRVTLNNPCKQNVFISHFDTSVRAIIARYGKKYVVFPHQLYQRPNNIREDVPVYEEYFNAILDNIKYLLTENPDRKTDFVQEAEDAYKTVSKSMLYGVKFRDANYYNYD